MWNGSSSNTKLYAICCSYVTVCHKDNSRVKGLNYSHCSCLILKETVLFSKF